MSRWSVAGFVGALAFALASLSGARIARAQAVEDWPHDANYVADIETFLSDIFPPGEPHPPLEVVRQTTIHGFSAVVAATSQVMRFGPFRIRNDQKTNGGEAAGGIGAGQPATFAVSILARSPKSLNPSAALAEIGRQEITLQSGQEQSFFITANLPGALRAPPGTC